MHIMCFEFVQHRNMCQGSKVFILTENFGAKCLSVSRLKYLHFSLKITVF